MMLNQFFPKLKLVLSFFLAAGTTLLLAQTTISGKVTSDDAEPLIGATIVEPSTGRGTVTDLDGNFTLRVASLPTVLSVSYLGYLTQEVNVESAEALTIVLPENVSKLDEIVVTGSRGKPRSILDSAVPIDNINASELKASGQKTVDQMINYKVPSYNSSNQTISDATAHFDPSELRNLGPSRTLVLINGKRKNQSALVYVNDTPGKGEVGVDMKSIPSAAIERIEVLRDGASAQYGSDAIAGVINIILKERPYEGEIELGGGVTTEGDGWTYNADINKGFRVGEAGFLNLTGSFYHQDYTNRAGEPGGDGLFGFLYDIGAIPIEAAGGFEATPGNIATGAQILNGDTDWQRANPDLGMIVGQPEYDKFSAFANFGMPYNEGKNEFYLFGGYTYRDGKSFALYRVPWWPGIPSNPNPLHTGSGPYQGFHPTFESTINDFTFTAGNRFDLSGWNLDVSLTAGSNSVDYMVNNSINVDLGASSPTSFDPGGYSFGNILANADISRSINNFTLSFGTEARRENFEVRAGQPESYEGGGTQSFPGLQPSNALEEDRTNIGIYGSVDWDVSQSFLVGGALRFENYSDFGSNVSWKINARQKLGDNKGAIRASLSTGFRAPSLHQIYLSNIQTLVSGGTVSNQGTFNNVSPVVRNLGIGQLDAETSFNITAGVTYKFADNISVAADFYNIKLDDRVLFSGEVGGTGDPDNPLDRTLAEFDVTSIKFFINAMDTKTTGLDVVLNFDNLSIGSDNLLDIIFAFNTNNTEIEGRIKTPEVLESAGIDIFNRKEQSRVTSARPDLKFALGTNWKFGDFRASLNNTYFGEVTWLHADDPANDQTFGAKVITDLILGYEINDRFRADVTVNNLFNVYPDELDPKGDFLTNLGGRFKWPWEVNQFGFLGTIIKVGLTVEL